MSKRRIVVALGGNAILTKDPSAKAQQLAIKQTVAQLIPLIKNGDQLVITHGNGPQVGNLLLQMSAAASPQNPVMPLDTAVAMTEGSIGFWLQNAFNEALAKEGLTNSVVTLVTQVEVAQNDPSFEKPTKPIGPFYDSAQAKRKQVENPTFTFVEDAGRGYRRVVPSPIPLQVVEAPVVSNLLKENVIPIVAGGGGVPVIKEELGYQGVEAVIDKDFASAKLASQIDADLLIILTAVDHVFVKFNTPEQKQLNKVHLNELETYLENNEFAAGSMLPKVKACMNFVNEKETNKAVITSLGNLNNFLEKNDGTIISQ